MDERRNERRDGGPDERSAQLERAALERDLAELAAIEARELDAERALGPVDGEEEALAAFRDQLEQHGAAPPGRRGPRRVAAAVVAAAAATALFFYPWPPPAEDPVDADPWLGVEGGGVIRVVRESDAATWFDLGIDPPADGFLELRLKDASGQRVLGPIELTERTWCYDRSTREPLPERFTIEVSPWIDTPDGPKPAGELLVEPFRSLR